jgi:NTP pyrophosphatase (non-canonical NTP hydrolase)
MHDNQPKTILNRYSEFVAAVTSNVSTDLTVFMDQLDRLDGNYEKFESETVMRHGPDINVPLLITAGLGLGSEAGEFQEIVKKVLFQGKKLDEATHFHLKRELGDIMWYWINACHSLGFDPNDVLAENVEKLKSRYPGGKFSIWHSENRKEGDL